ncbi:hypothetical protein Tco_0003949 [Tanacetum coccineum]
MVHGYLNRSPMAMYLDGDGMMMTEASLSCGLINTGIVNKEVDKGEEAVCPLVHSSPTTIFGSIWLGNTGCVNDDVGYCVDVHAISGNGVTLSSSLGKRNHTASCIPMHVVNINFHIAAYNGHGEVNVDVNETTQSVHIVVLGSSHNGKNGRGELLGIMNPTTHGCYFSIFQLASLKMCAEVMEISCEGYLEDVVEINYILNV